VGLLVPYVVLEDGAGFETEICCGGLGDLVLRLVGVEFELEDTTELMWKIRIIVSIGSFMALHTFFFSFGFFSK